MKKMFAAVACAALALSACATVTRGTRQSFTVNTVPSGAYVRLSSGEECTATPCTFARISREAEFSVTISKPGYRTTTHAITHQASGGGAAGMAGNVLLGGIIGGAIDANSGATQELIPNPLNVTLDPEPAPAASAAPPVVPPSALAPAEAAAPSAPPAQ
ncbi:MAG: PEGA domain-containing protein [Hyphomonadaceae bacterium]|nr:PEGA domain-containing protein [Hyphomonadaceae bacterium]